MMKGTRTIKTLTIAVSFAMCHGPRASAQVKPATDSVRMADMADNAMSGPMDHSNANMMKHMQLTPLRPPTRADSLRAMKVVDQLRHAIATYQDTAAAVAASYTMFLPGVKKQKIYHFTNYARAFKEAFRFDPEQPTSLLYSRGADGAFRLIGAMYTMPERAKLSRLDDRIPLSIARWHKHVNWCLPKKNEQARWAEQRNGAHVFGPESPIATRAECEQAGGVFHHTIFGWMVHVNVNEGSQLGQIFGDVH